MILWLEISMVAISACLLITVLLYFILFRRRRRSSPSHQEPIVVTNHQESSTTTTPTKQELLKTAPFPASYHVFRRGGSSSSTTTTKSIFSWADHPSLITDAVENGWSRFAFTNHVSLSVSLRSPSSLFSSLRVTDDHHHLKNNKKVEMSWEAGEDSVDFMQKIRFYRNGGTSAIRTALPLPGPPCYFPQEAYFEIRVLSCGHDDVNISNNNGEGEKVKLIQQQQQRRNTSNNNSMNFGNSDCLGNGHGNSKGNCGEKVKMSMGLVVGGSSTMTNCTSKLPGTYPGSIGFHSNGSVFLSGMKLVFESEKEDWAQVGKVIGCGFDPAKKKVFLTVDSKLVQVIICKSEDFGRPLYPILTSTINITILVNLGQSPFSYSLANLQRAPNPCFIGPIVNSSASTLGYEDSQELFSMERIESDWLNRNATIKSTISNNSTNNYNHIISKTNEYDEESEADLFEIVLDTTRS